MSSKWKEHEYTLHVLLPAFLSCSYTAVFFASPEMSNEKHESTMSFDEPETSIFISFVLLLSRATVVTWASVVRPSVKLILSETTKFWEMVPIHHSARSFFFFFSIFFYFWRFFFSFLLTWEHVWEEKKSNGISFESTQQIHIHAGRAFTN